MVQQQPLEALTKDTSSSSSVLVPICHGKQLIKLNPPPVAQSATSAQNKLLLVHEQQLHPSSNMMVTYPQHCHQVFIQEYKHLNYSLRMMIFISI